MSGVITTRRAAAGALAAIAIGAVGAGTVGAKSAGKSDKGTVNIGEIGVKGNTHLEAGSFTDKIFKHGALTFNTTITIKPGVVHFDSNTLTFWTPTGSLTGHVSADINGKTATSATVTNGKISLTKGTGAQKGHSLVGTFTGSGNPSTTEYGFVFKATYK